MRLQNFISMLTSQLKEEEYCYDAAVRAKNFFLVNKIMQRITSLKKAIDKTTMHSNESLYVSQIKFQLL
ncbi:hypothetical protein FRZ67_03155 [Panacibacter ginsenosidivorans]|uniref:Uncharacterized protein n=1 Tax=Panacibacter ginsenosidivorans TaxID=1813871 RepID=A0A5B8V592_9BACT|nr:hypothetical protein [Panacibacter ginsenosidivorans]QEC66349.1 hypothetical protein FRZ67_03155 [Panacibacter ginsenosidivorans]